jgi:hypothetical protein
MIEVDTERSIHIVCSPNSFEPRALCARGAHRITVPHAERQKRRRGSAGQRLEAANLAQVFFFPRESPHL